ncbi:MAG TPA: histidine phosphatase family protein [Ferruginibacter sp.]|nr:histidine phosphatase family protein [Ferruginibacter sp.]HPH90271.1 histidine phosphatase family protein [Ferruginibacter sp.]
MQDENNINDYTPIGLGSKRLLVIRHAKSSWDIGTLNDFERPLNERGKRDAPEMAGRLKEKNVLIDAFVASPAKRAKKTAEYFIEVYGRSKEDIMYVSKLYHAPAEIFFEVAENLPEHFNTVAIFSHNPGITEFVNLLTNNLRLDNMPTCGIFAVRFQGAWKSFVKAKKEFIFFDYPKNG